MKFAGRSVKGTMVSLCASAGMAQSGTNARSLAAANPLLTVSLRVMYSDMLSLQVDLRAFYLLRYDIASGSGALTIDLVP